MEQPQDNREVLKQQLQDAERNVTANIERLTKSIESVKDSIGDKTTQKFTKKVSCVNLYLTIQGQAWTIRYFIYVILYRPSLQ